MKKLRSLLLIIAILLCGSLCLVGCSDKNEEYSIEVESCTHGSITVDKSTAKKGDKITVTATADEGYKISVMTYNGVKIVDNTFAMPARDVEIKGTFVIDEDTYQYNITVASTQNGTVVLAKNKAKAGESVILVAQPASGYKLSVMTYNGIQITGNSFVMPSEDVVINAVFSANTSSGGGVEEELINIKNGVYNCATSFYGPGFVDKYTQQAWFELKEGNKFDVGLFYGDDYVTLTDNPCLRQGNKMVSTVGGDSYEVTFIEEDLCYLSLGEGSYAFFTRNETVELEIGTYVIHTFNAADISSINFEVEEGDHIKIAVARNGEATYYEGQYSIKGTLLTMDFGVTQVFAMLYNDEATLYVSNVYTYRDHYMNLVFNSQAFINQTEKRELVPGLYHAFGTTSDFYEFNRELGKNTFDYLEVCEDGKLNMFKYLYKEGELDGFYYFENVPYTRVVDWMFLSIPGIEKTACVYVSHYTYGEEHSKGMHLDYRMNGVVLRFNKTAPGEALQEGVTYHLYGGDASMVINQGQATIVLGSDEPVTAEVENRYGILKFTFEDGTIYLADYGIINKEENWLAIYDLYQYFEGEMTKVTL